MGYCPVAHDHANLMPTVDAVRVFYSHQYPSGFSRGMAGHSDPVPAGGYQRGITNGVTGAVVLVSGVLFVQSGREMIGKAMMHRFDGSVMALVG